MRRKINFRLIGLILLSLVDDAIILAIIIVVLRQFGLGIPWWAIAILALFLAAISFLFYRILRRNPQLGFDNMVGLTGVTVGPVGRRGTIKIKGELWSATARDGEIKGGVEVIVIEQIGLKLTVIPANRGVQDST
jgi:membrane-bound ClpP family serine protease